jgi:hypothetical protein
LSVPKRPRYFVQRDGAVLNMVLRIFLRVIAQSLQPNCPGAATGGRPVTLHNSQIAFGQAVQRSSDCCSIFVELGNDRS